MPSHLTNPGIHSPAVIPVRNAIRLPIFFGLILVGWVVLHRLLRLM